MDDGDGPLTLCTATACCWSCGAEWALPQSAAALQPPSSSWSFSAPPSSSQSFLSALSGGRADSLLLGMRSAGSTPPLSDAFDFALPPLEDAGEDDGDDGGSELHPRGGRDRAATGLFDVHPTGQPSFALSPPSPIVDAGGFLGLRRTLSSSESVAQPHRMWQQQQQQQQHRHHQQAYPAPQPQYSRAPPPVASSGRSAGDVPGNAASLFLFEERIHSASAIAALPVARSVPLLPVTAFSSRPVQARESGHSVAQALHWPRLRGGLATSTTAAVSASHATAGRSALLVSPPPSASAYFSASSSPPFASSLLSPAQASSLGALYVDELCAVLALAALRFRQRCHAALQYILLHGGARSAFDAHRHVWLDGAADQPASSALLQAAQSAHVHALAAAVLQFVLELQSREQSEAPPPRAPTLERLCALLAASSPPSRRSCWSAALLSQYVDEVHALLQTVDVDSLSGAASASSVLARHPLLVDACRPSFLQYASKFPLDADTIVLAVDMLNAAVRLNLSHRRNHSSLSAAALFLACALQGVRLTQHDFCTRIGLTEVTLRKVNKELGQHWRSLVPSGYQEKAVPTFLAKHSTVQLPLQQRALSGRAAQEGSDDVSDGAAETQAGEADAPAAQQARESAHSPLPHLDVSALRRKPSSVVQSAQRRSVESPPPSSPNPPSGRLSPSVKLEPLERGESVLTWRPALLPPSKSASAASLLRLQPAWLSLPAPPHALTSTCRLPSSLGLPVLRERGPLLSAVSERKGAGPSSDSDTEEESEAEDDEEQRSEDSAALSLRAHRLPPFLPAFYGVPSC